jgi:hypothetical protein
MSIRHRPMRPQDVRECVEIVAAHPVAGPRYGNAITNLGLAWHRLLERDGFCAATVFEEVGGGAPQLLGVGVSVFVPDSFLHELKTPPRFWLGPELAHRVATGELPVLLPKRILEANSRGGLNLVIWQATVRPQDMHRMEIWNAFMTAGVQHHSGYLLKELLVAQAESIEHLLGLRHTGRFFWNGTEQRYSDLPPGDLPAIVRTPHVLGITREMAVDRPLESITSVIGSLFLYQPSQFGFSRSEQRLLLAALNGGTDQELSAELDVSLSTVKKTWRCIYDRVAARVPELIPTNSDAEDGASERGKGKKQRLIAYLRHHAEELRPVSRRLLREAAGPGHPTPARTKRF